MREATSGGRFAFSKLKSRISPAYAGYSLKGFDGALIVVSRDEIFLQAIGIGREIVLG
jgi:hypothetical protein